MLISFIRTIILYLCVVVAVRLMGKRQIGDLQPAEFVVTFLIAELAAIPMQDMNIPMLSGLIPIFTLAALELTVSFIMLKNVKIRKLLTGKPLVIIKDGQLLTDEMTKARLTTEDLMEEMREQGVFHIEHISYAILETNGKLSILQKPAQLPVTASAMNQNPPDDGMPVVVISDGDISDFSMRLIGVDAAFIKSILKKEKIERDKVFLMTVDKAKNYYIVKKG